MTHDAPTSYLRPQGGVSCLSLRPQPRTPTRGGSIQFRDLSGTNNFDYTRPKTEEVVVFMVSMLSTSESFTDSFMDSWIHTYYQGSKAAASGHTFFPTAPGSSFRNMRGSGSCPCPWQNPQLLAGKFR